MNPRLANMLGRQAAGRFGLGGTDMGGPVVAQAPTAAPSGAAASASIGGVDISGRMSAAILMVAVVGLMGFYIGTRGTQL